MNDISIVTAFFDIGRGDWSSDNGHPEYLKRSTDEYFSYFKNLANLENKIIVFTSEEYKDKILEIRGDKPTVVFVVNIKNKFKKYLKKIAEIQKSKFFLDQVEAEQLKNPEYWSPEYVLVNNLKAYFVRKAIKSGHIDSRQVAWVDFGYCRKSEVLNNIKNWKYSFKKDKIHFFTIKRYFDVNAENVSKFIFSNQVFLIDGVIVGEKEKWSDFFNLISFCQNKFLESGIVDDDQGIYLTALLENPQIFHLNYLGDSKWFDVFKKFDVSTKLSFKDFFKKLFGYY